MSENINTADENLSCLIAFNDFHSWRKVEGKLILRRYIVELLRTMLEGMLERKVRTSSV
jgi:hypothetical protein